MVNTLKAATLCNRGVGQPWLRPCVAVWIYAE